MTRYDRPPSNSLYGVAETSTSMDALIRPCIRQAFPLPPADHPDDERFRLLLGALAQRSGGTS